jgi:hypothetical protein
MEKKWVTVIPADLKRLCKWDMYVPLVTKGLKTELKVPIASAVMPATHIFLFLCT